MAEPAGAAAARPRWLRVAGFDLLIDVFIVAAVTTMVITRALLGALGFPQLGGNGLHISHMLWGGLLLASATLVLLLDLDRRMRFAMALLAGAGFGLFIDELGKFITSDNDYFYRPTFALVYALLVLLYLAAKVGFKRRSLTAPEYLANAIEYLQDAASGGLTPARRSLALAYLQRADTLPLAAGLRDLLAATPVLESDSLDERLGAWYGRCCDTASFRRLVCAAFGLELLVLFGQLGVLGLLTRSAWQARQSGLLGGLAADAFGLSAVALIQIATCLACAVLTGIGLRRLSRSRTRAYGPLEATALLAILVAQALAFFESWAVALAGLAVALPVWALLKIAIDQETRLQLLQATDDEVAVRIGTSAMGRSVGRNAAAKLE